VFVALMGAPFILPVIVAVLGLLAIFGRAGWLNAGLEAIGAGTISIYGLAGIVLAHAFLNLPLAVRLDLQAWLSVPSERVRLAASLGFSDADMRRHFERPILRAVLPGAFMIVFLICTTSFAVALILGGGPRATTVELAIYQAFRFEFDLGRAAMLGLDAGGDLRGGGAAGAGLRCAGATWAQGWTARRWRGPVIRFRARLIDGAAILGAGAFLMLPLVAVLLEGALAILAAPRWSGPRRCGPSSWRFAPRRWPSRWRCPSRSSPRGGAGWVETLAALSISVSPLVMGTGLFLILFPVADPVALALPVTGVVNALVALPFILRGLIPEVRRAEATQGRLADALGLTGGRGCGWRSCRACAGRWASARGWRRRFRWGIWGSSRCFRPPGRRPCRWRCTG
jgi:thiamine transport system permease protein